MHTPVPWSSKSFIDFWFLPKFLCAILLSLMPNHASSLLLGPVANATDVLQPWGLMYYPIPPSV